MKILIVGAGISGLSMALALQKVGIQSTIIEKSSKLSPDGAGIALPKNATELLYYLGLKSPLLNCAREISSITYSLPNGAILSTANLADHFGNEYPFVGMKRKDLINILSKELVSNIIFNTFVTNINQLNEDKVSVSFNNGSHDTFDVVIAADGVNSDIRNTLLPNTTIENLGLTVFRFIVNQAQDDPVYYFGNQTAFMIYPINSMQSYCYGHIANSLIKDEKMLGNIHVFFEDYVDQVKSLIKDNQMIFGKLLSIQNPVCVKNNILFVGDASHACSPMLQQGAGSAIEDAITFSTFLKKASSIQQAFIHYELFRKPRLDWIRLNSDTPLKLMSSYQHPENLENMKSQIKENGPLNVLKWRELFAVDFIQQLNSYVSTNFL